MKKANLIILSVVLLAALISNPVSSQGPLDPVRLHSMVVNIGVGSGAHYFGNGVGVGPALKASFEAGMFDLGPGVVTLGGEAAWSLFGTGYGYDSRETWFNFMIGARAAYHYGWDVEGLDTYAGVPAGIGFCMHSVDGEEGYHGSQPVYPYFGFFFGASYFFNKSIGINGEVGYNATHANIGVIFKIK
jgi:hypothetical protein